MTRIIIYAGGEVRDWTHNGEVMVRALALELSMFQPVVVRIERESNITNEYLYLNGVEAFEFTTTDWI